MSFPLLFLLLGRTNYGIRVFHGREMRTRNIDHGEQSILQNTAEGCRKTVKVVVLRDYDRGFSMKQALVEMTHDEDEFHPLAALAMMANMRVELEITLEKWNLGN